MIVAIRKKWYLASVDMTKAYWQLPLHEDDQKKATFIVEDGAFSFLRIPFGLAGAPAYYQSTLRNELDKCDIDRQTCVLRNYIDDVIIGSETFEVFVATTE